MRGDCFTFADAEDLLPYLDDLGVSHLYLSPILTAVHGSTHGYDVTDPTTVSAELGGAEGLARLSAAARSRGMGLIVDIVPNHLGVDKPEQNKWWWDVLKHGRDSAYASFFDIDWDAGRRPNRVAGAGFRRRRRRPRGRRGRAAARRPRAIPSRRGPAQAPAARCTIASTTA